MSDGWIDFDYRKEQELQLVWLYCTEIFIDQEYHSAGTTHVSPGRRDFITIATVSVDADGNCEFETAHFLDSIDETCTVHKYKPVELPQPPTE